MSLLLPRNPSTRVAQAGVVGGAALLVFIAYTVPPFGLLASLGLPYLTHTARRQLWPEASTTRSLVWSLLAWAGLWLPGVIGFLAQGFYASSVEVSTTWLLLPLCAPTGLSAVLLPALAAAVTCLAGLYVAAVSRNGWAWVITAWLAPLVHFLVFSQLPHEFFC